MSVLVPHLEEHLHKMDISFDRDLLRGITKIFPGMSRSGVLRTFLAVGSQLEDIPKGIKGKKASGTVYQRCTEINAEAFETSTLETNYKMLIKCVLWCVGLFFNTTITSQNLW